jgi:CRP/FNR family transcriptional regulator
MGPVVLYGIRKRDLEIILRDHPQVVLNVIQVLSHRIRHLVSLVGDLSFRNVIGRVAKILLDYAGDGAGSRPGLTQQEMAAMAGTAREMVGRSLKSLEDEGAIRMDHHRIVITDKEALKEIVEASS